MASNNLSITPLDLNHSPHRAIADSGCINHLLAPTTTCSNMVPTTHGILIGLPNGATMRCTYTALLNFMHMPLTSRQSQIFPALAKKYLISIGKLFENGFTATFDTTSVSLSDRCTIIRGPRDLINGL